MIHLISALLAFSPADTYRMTVFMNGTRVGSATIGRKVDGAGRMHGTIHTEMQAGEFKRTMDYESTTDRRGRPVIENEIDVINGQKSKIVIATGPKALSVSIEASGKSRKFTVPIPKGKIEDPTTFWFVTVRPKPGTTATYLSYDLQSSKWEKRTETYTGDEIVPETKVRGHHIKVSDGDQWLDDRGLELRSVHKLPNGIVLLAVRERS